MSDSPFIDDDDMPFAHNPVRNLPWLDTMTEVTAFQFRPTLENRLAEWCGGVVAILDGQLVVHIPGDPPTTAHLSDFVVFDGENYRVEPADGFNHRYWPVGRDPGWQHRCFMKWEEPD